MGDQLIARILRMRVATLLTKANRLDKAVEALLPAFTISNAMNWLVCQVRVLSRACAILLALVPLAIMTSNDIDGDYAANSIAVPCRIFTNVADAFR